MTPAGQGTKDGLRWLLRRPAHPRPCEARRHVVVACEQVHGAGVVRHEPHQEAPQAAHDFIGVQPGREGLERVPQRFGLGTSLALGADGMLELKTLQVELAALLLGDALGCLAREAFALEPAAQQPAFLVHPGSYLGPTVNMVSGGPRRAAPCAPSAVPHSGRCSPR